ncbi:thioesterase domain-containing protein [Phycobium rhodophyticola]
MRVTLERSDLGYDMSVRGTREIDGRQGFETNAQAVLSLLPMGAPEAVDLAALEARCARVETAQEGRSLRSPQEAHLRFGAHWRVLRRAAYGAGEGVARLKLAEGLDEAGYRLHPGLLDLATGWAMELIEGYDGAHLWVPVSYGAVRVYRDLPGEVVSWVRNAGENRASAGAASFDVTICDTQGNVCVEVHNFSIRQMEAGAALFAEPQVRDLEFPDAEANRPLSPAEERLRHNLSQGIRPEEGAEAFMRALAMDRAQVIVSSLSLPDLVRQAAAESGEEREAQTFQRPDLETEFVAPEGAIEQRLAQFWGGLLGVEQIGAEDNFFDLGGHSLIAVRLFAMVKKEWSVDFPISVLFEAPTIRACAKMIASEGVSEETSGDGSVEVARKTPERRFTHLVPMHQGEGGPRRPFFLVAGMFGNVLNLRHLAHLLGADRPFYGLQAKGLLGEDEPHRSIVDAAKDYLGEMRQVQPKGPYMLGGFSGGGIIAYEIAQQLKAAGDEVAMLVMLDTPLPQRRPLSGRDRVVIQLQELKAGGFAYPFKWAARRIAWEFEKRANKDPQGFENAEVSFHNSAIEEAFLAAVAQYELQPWDGPLALFRPPLQGKWEVAPGRWVNSERAYVTSDNDWTPKAPLVEVVEVPGDHDSMVLEPNVRVLAARMKRLIEDAENPGARAARVAALPTAKAAG